MQGLCKALYLLISYIYIMKKINIADLIECPDCGFMYSSEEYDCCPQCEEMKKISEDIFADASEDY